MSDETSKVVYLRIPDAEFIREFADRVEGYQKQGRNVRTTIVICCVDNDLEALAHTEERLSTLLGTLHMTCDIIKEEYAGASIEEGES